MEDVVLHHRPGSATGLGSLLETTERLLQSFPRRTPPVFSPWFPSAADLHPPIRPAKPAPVITCSEDAVVCASSAFRPHDGETPQKPKHHDVRTPKRARLCDDPEDEVGPHKPRSPAQDSPLKRSWSVLAQRRVVLQSAQSLSKNFHRLVSNHRLHLRQRVRWVIGRHNCGDTRDIEQVWQEVSRAVRSSSLPTCNANIQRERAEIWVFCDVLHSEQVGRLLKDELRLSGRIGLCARTLGNFFNM